MYLLDTHALYWMAVDKGRLSDRVIALIASEGTSLFISAITGFEYVDLVNRGRLPGAPLLGAVTDAFAIRTLAFPAQAVWLAQTLDPLHRDPIDRMLIAHAVVADMTVITCDAMIHKYPAATLW